MSWEVSSMLSKRSFFNRTLFRKNLTRFWPLWGGVSLAGSLVPLYVLLSLLGMPDAHVKASEFAYTLYVTDVYAVPALTAAYAILCAMAVWGYLYNNRSVGLMHTLPIDRTGLFVTNTLSGLAMVLIPYAVVGLFGCLIALGGGFFELTAVVNTALTVVFLSVLFFGLATLCAMLTGHVVVLPVLYLLANFLAPLLEALLFSLAECFLVGVGFDGSSLLTELFSPLFAIYNRFSYGVEPLASGDGAPYLTGFWVVAVYALVGVALLVLAWLLYRRRQSERAGDVAAFRWLRPVFRYGTAFLSGLTLGRLLYELLWVAVLFQQGDYADFIPLCVCMALTGVLGYYAASMLLEKSLRVFRGSWPGVAAVCVGAVLVCGIVRMDVFGAERWVPDPAEVTDVYLWDYEARFEFDQTEPERIAQVIGIHQAIVADRDYVREGVNRPYQRGECVSRYIGLTYTLRSGKTVRRTYSLWVTAERAADPSTYDGRLLALYAQGDTARSRVEIPAGAELRAVNVYNYGSGGSFDGDAALAVYDAILQDAAEGNVPGYDLLRDGPESYGDLHVELESRFWERDGYRHSYKQIEIYPSMTHTLQTMQDLGYVTAGEIETWNRQMDPQADEESGEIIPADTAAHP